MLWAAGAAGVVPAAGRTGSAMAADMSPRPPGPKPHPPGRGRGLAGRIQRFAPSAWGYTLDLPGDWVVSTPAPFTMVAAGPAGTELAFAPIGIQNRRAAVPDDPEGSAVRLLADHKAALTTRFGEIRVIRETLFRPPPGSADGHRTGLPHGRQLVVEWPGASGVVMRQWAIARPRPRAAVVHLWTFTADPELFALVLPTARAVLDTWSLRDAAS